MPYLSSIILSTNINHNPIEAFVSWLEHDNGTKLNRENIKNRADVILINQEGESIKIKTIREIKDRLVYTSYQHNQIRYFVFLNAQQITVPAQNALLKSVEEPPINTQLVFVTHSHQKLIDTIKSRCQIVIISRVEQPNSEITQESIKKNSSQEIVTLYNQILQSNPGQKITLASQYKEREDALIVCQQLLNYLHALLKNKSHPQPTKQIASNCKVILQTIDSLEQNANVALTLEHCFFEII